MNTNGLVGVHEHLYISRNSAHTHTLPRRRFLRHRFDAIIPCYYVTEKHELHVIMPTLSSVAAKLAL